MDEKMSNYNLSSSEDEGNTLVGSIMSLVFEDLKKLNIKKFLNSRGSDAAEKHQNILLEDRKLNHLFSGVDGTHWVGIESAQTERSTHFLSGSIFAHTTGYMVRKDHAQLFQEAFDDSVHDDSSFIQKYGKNSSEEHSTTLSLVELHEGGAGAPKNHEEPQSFMRTTEKHLEAIHICSNCKIGGLDVFARGDCKLRCLRCHIYNRRHGVERPELMIQNEPTKNVKQCFNCGSTICRQWRRDVDKNTVCSLCNNYYRRTGKKRPMLLAWAYRGTSNEKMARIQKPRKLIRFKRGERICSNCSTKRAKTWRAGEENCCLCSPCWSYWYRTKKNRPKHLWY